ncbi:MAG TPA: tetratricopeptide repeat protein [Thermodesulfobacteriota bacterium]|nr:tetratricopeptide repeat protein [Thermodesulfobacteriota bacterium]
MKGRPRFQVGGRAFAYAIIISFWMGFLAGCGPTHEEIMAQEQARLQREAREREEADARRQAEQARDARVRAAVTACSDSAAQGDLDAALLRCQGALKDIQRYSDQDQQVREMIIKIARAMPSPPATPEETVRFMARGEAKLKMGGAGSYEGAANEMEQAVSNAPWLADAYLNLGIVQEKAEMFGKAIRNFRLYLLASPESPNAKAVQAKIYALEVSQEEQAKMQSLAGVWRSGAGNAYKATLEGRRIKINGSGSLQNTDGGKQTFWLVFDLEKKGASLDGSAQIAREGLKGCNFPNETVPVSGSVGGDGRTMRLQWKESVYQWTWQGSVCTGVSSLGKADRYVDLYQGASPVSGETNPGPSPVKKSSDWGKKPVRK